MGLEMKELLETMPQVGRVRWLGVRPVKREPVQQVQSVTADENVGLIDDHFRGGTDGKRQVTLIQHEHLAAV